MNISVAVMPALVAGIHVFKAHAAKTWMAETSPAMTNAGNIGVYYCTDRNGEVATPVPQAWTSSSVFIICE